MARIKLNQKLKGAVLLESMLAMIVVMLCFGIAVMIYNNVVAGSREKIKVLARIQLATEAEKAKAGERLLDETIECNGFRIERRVLPYRDAADLCELELTAIMPDGKQIAEYHELLCRP